MEIKSGSYGADVRYWTARTWGAAVIAKFLWMERHQPHPFVITSGVEGKHQDKSAHYRGDAGDLRTKDIGVAPSWRLSDEEREDFRQELERRLGDEFDVVVSAAGNIHWEFDPVKPVR